MNKLEWLLLCVSAIAVVMEIKSCATFKIDCDEGVFICTKRFFCGEPIYRHSDERWLIWHDGLIGKWACVWVTNPKCTKITRREAAAMAAGRKEENGNA